MTKVYCVAKFYNMTKSPFKKTNINSVFIMCLAFFIAGCKEMLPVPQMSQNNTEIKSALAAPSNITATHGLKRKIRLTWTGTSSAKCYYIYSASTPFDEYVQINETTNDNTYIELAVPSGYSGYFKVAAVNGLGEVSDKSLAVYGTSLATPQITSIQEDQTSATVYWFMENLNRKTYLDDIHFTAICYDSKSNEVGRKTLAGTTETFCTFDGLSSGTKYFYEVEAYLGSDGDSIEKSLKLDSETVVSLTPAVPKFTVSEGTRDDRIDINITLPPMVKILVESGSGGANQASYEDRPLYFKISKLNDSTGEYDELVKYIPFNYNGKNPIQEIGKDSPEFDNYKEGDVITYSDFVEPNKVERGKKYTYKVFACTDNYYNSKGERLSPVSDDKKTTAQTGWAASVPRIFSSSIEYDYEESETETEAETVTVKTKIAARLEITTAWDSIGKENEYVYMLLQNHKTLESATGDGKDSFIAKQDGSCYFDTLEEIKSVPLTFDLKTNPESVRGYYRYSFYIVPKSVKSEVSDPNQNVDTIKEKSLTHIDDISSKLISDGDVDIVPNIKVEDGYKDKVIIKWEAKDNVNYKLVRYTLDNEGSIDNSITAVSVDSDKLTGGTYTDNEIESGKAYSYTVYASNDQISDVPSNTVKAYTLGTPVVSFDTSEIDYDSITVKWNTVMHNAEYLEKGSSMHGIKYKVEYNGNSYNIAQSDMIDESSSIVEKSSDDYDVKCIDGKEFILKIKKNIAGFNYGSKPVVSAKNAGAASELIVQASNDVTKSEPSNYTQGSVSVKVLGPAEIALTTSKAAYDKQINVSWNVIEGAAGYVIRRICPRTRLGEEEDKTDYITVSASGNVTNNGESVGNGRTVLTSNSGVINISDKYCAASDTTSLYQTNQEKIDVGLEYDYTVMPVKNLNDNPFEDFKIVYQNEDDVSAKGYTNGYGIKTLASKADYADKIEVTWKKPNTSSATFPQAFYRKVGDSKWEKFGQLSSGDEKIDFVPPQDSRDKKFEFMVSYRHGDEANFEDTYIAYEKAQTDGDEIYGEQNNMGYQFALSAGNLVAEQPTASNESFSEKIYWTLWDANTRKHAPDSYEIMVKNLNCSSEWFTIAEISKDGTVTPKPKNWYDVSYEMYGNSSMKITALNNGSKFTTTKRLTRASGQADAITGTHNGLLKVQRDYKHYYKLVAKREGKYGEVVTALGEFDNTDRNDAASKIPVYTYRKISDDEFVKCVNLIVADAVYKVGIDSGGSRTIPGTTGEFYLKHKSCSKTVAWGTSGTNYKHVFTSGNVGSESQALESAFTINMSNSEERRSVDINTLYHLPWGAMTVTNETGLSSYQGTVVLSAGVLGSKGLTELSDGVNLEFDLSLQYSHLINADLANENKICITTAYPADTLYNDARDGCYTVDSDNRDKDKFLQWFPYWLGKDRKDPVTSKTDEVPVYSGDCGDWWQVKTSADK